MTINSLVFYEINSKKSEISTGGTRQISMSCEDHANIFCFLWLNAKDQIEHIQLIFGEQVLEWSLANGVCCKKTNRMMNPEGRIGIRKGSLFMADEQDPVSLKQTKDKLYLCKFPEKWNSTIHSIFSF